MKSSPEYKPSTKNEFLYNPVVSAHEKQNPRFKSLLDWATKNGMKYRSIDFPACFGDVGQFRGVVATQDIQPYEVIMAIPNRLLMTTASAREDKTLDTIFNANPEVFDDEDFGNWNILVTYLLYERAKGNKSFYYPYINYLHQLESPMSWKTDTLALIECPVFRGEFEQLRKKLDEDWNRLQPVFQKRYKLFGE